ncbi:MAG: NAD(P)/FAD-dependent oxidoreductase [Actinobacteria bacterium]|nr:MAG: NAD(P)/FAD-dependent oxidoreductase [Actinomycetota bacterium]
MKRLLILGSGTAGTIIVNKLHRRLPEDWEIHVVEPSREHLYQPGLLFLPFGRIDPRNLHRETEAFLPKGVTRWTGTVQRVVPDGDKVELEDGTVIEYDQLVIATGTTPRPDQTPGMTGPGWRETIHDFYTYEGALALWEALRNFEGGRLVVHVSEMPIKCPVAPLEFAFLADDHFRELGIRDDVDVVYVTPLSGAFTKPVASRRLGDMLSRRRIELETDFYVERIEDGALWAYDEREVPFDLLVTVPVNMGAKFVGESGLGDELDFVKVDQGTFLAEGYENIFAIGDAAALPTSKAGSVAHFAADVFVENFLEHIAGLPMTRRFDGHANCFVEAGGGKALLIDFNYDTEPLPGKYPLASIGPLSLLKETRANHLGKLAFEKIYWNVLLPGRPMPVASEMSMAGKIPADQIGDEL